MPVWTPATTEAFATYGEIDQSGAIVQPVRAPSNVFPQFGGLEISTSSTQLQALTDAVLYLVAYPFECSEQLASRVLGRFRLELAGVPAPRRIPPRSDRRRGRRLGVLGGPGVAATGTAHASQAGVGVQVVWRGVGHHSLGEVARSGT